MANNADNMTVTAKIGETGKVITVVLKDTDPDTQELEPKDLTDYTEIKMYVKKIDKTTGETTTIIDGADCVADVDQDTNPGKITCTTDITKDEHEGLIKGDFKLEFSGLNGAGAKRYWPMNKSGDRTYGRFVVQDALS